VLPQNNTAGAVQTPAPTLMGVALDIYFFIRPDIGLFYSAYFLPAIARLQCILMRKNAYYTYKYPTSQFG